MDEKKFKRVEKKYLITEEKYRAILKLVKKNMHRDFYHKSSIMNIYFDNDNYDLIIQSIDQPVFKHKLRARSYVGYDKVFLELKTKIRGIAYRKGFIETDDIDDDVNLGYKRRVLITHDDYRKYTEEKSSLVELASKKLERKSDIQIAREIEYAVNRFNLKPKILVYYDRESYVDKKGLRITFDRDLKFRDRNLNFSKNKKDRSLFSGKEYIIMEVKTSGAMPLWLVKKLSSEHAYPQQFSKIGKIYELIRKEKNV